jgi:c(7)-type cytochrome triheme protein
MQDPPRSRWPKLAVTAIAALVSALIWFVGAAIAQQAGQAPADVEPQPTDLFGSLPEPPTERAPAAPVLDPANRDSMRLQRPQEAFSTLPVDTLGRPDWMRALRDGVIRPRSGVTGGEGIQTLDLDIIMKNTAQMPFVKFPHQSHTAWLDCSNCHDAIFVPKTGANAISMAQILRGESCGICHTTVAFTAMFACERCHNVLQAGQKAWW